MTPADNNIVNALLGIVLMLVGWIIIALAKDSERHPDRSREVEVAVFMVGLLLCIAGGGLFLTVEYGLLR